MTLETPAEAQRRAAGPAQLKPYAELEPGDVLEHHGLMVGETWTTMVVSVREVDDGMVEVLEVPFPLVSVTRAEGAQMPGVLPRPHVLGRAAMANLRGFEHGVGKYPLDTPVVDPILAAHAVVTAFDAKSLPELTKAIEHLRPYAELVTAVVPGDDD